MPEVTFEVTCTAAIYVVRVDDKAIEFTNDKGAKAFSSGTHGLTWHIAGNPGAKFSIEAKVGDISILKIEDRKIPPKREMAWGLRNLVVPT
jgi:hypothetical protein